MIIKSSGNGKTTLSVTDIGKSCPSRKFLPSQVCLLTLFGKINFSGQFSDLQYFYTYTQTKKKRPFFMVLYLSIQLRCRNKNKTKMFIKRRTHKNWLLLIFYLLFLKGYWTLCAHSFFHYHQEVNQQNVTHFTLKGNQNRPTMKKHLKIPSQLNERVKLQFKTFHLRNKPKLPPFELNK